MTLEAIDHRCGVFSDADARWLRAVYLLAISALGHTHHVDELVKGGLADSVIKVCGAKPRFRLSCSEADMSDLAVSSIESLAKAHPHLLVMKH